MSQYIPKPDAEDINVPPSAPLRDALILLIGFFAIIGAALVIFGLLGAWAARNLSPKDEAKLFGTFKLEQKFKQKSEPAFAALLNQLAGDLPVKSFLLCEKTPNAFAMPGGTVMVTSGLLKGLKSENGLAFVLGHELGHFVNRDHLLGLGRGLGMLVVAAFFGVADLDFLGLNIGIEVVGNSFSRQQEAAADEYALQLVQKKYGHLSGVEEFFNHILKSEMGWQHQLPSFISTHPNAHDRLQVIHERQAGHSGRITPLEQRISQALGDCAENH
ncbi:MAG: M48 family metallopeptidase [Bdellovibrionales bacterium]